MPNLQYHTKPKLAVGDEAGMRPDRSVSSTESFTDLPYELLELIAYNYYNGQDLICWLQSCKGAAVQLGVLALLTKLPAIMGHYHIGLMEQLKIHNIDNLEQCYVIVKVSYLYVNGIRFGARCLEMINNVKISKTTKLHFNFGQSTLRSALSDRIVGLLTKLSSQTSRHQLFNSQLKS